MTTAIEAAAYTSDGARRTHAVQLPVDTFDGLVHEPALHQAVKVFLANQRQGTAKTKTRGFVSGGNQKPWRQKGTGRARQGSIRAPNWPGGGKVFGPIPRDYRLGIPRKLRRLARTSALNARAREHAIAVIEQLQFPEPKTQRMAALLDRLGLTDRRVLVLTHGVNQNVVLSARNIADLDVKRFEDAAAYDILRAEALVIEEPALGMLAQGTEQAEAPAPPAEKKVRTEAPTHRRTEEVDATAAKKKPAARKAAGTGAPAHGRAEKAGTRPAPKKPAAKKAAAAKKPAAKKPSAAAKPKRPKKKD